MCSKVSEALTDRIDFENEAINKTDVEITESGEFAIYLKQNEEKANEVYVYYDAGEADSQIIEVARLLTGDPDDPITTIHFYWPTDGVVILQIKEPSSEADSHTQDLIECLIRAL